MKHWLILLIFIGAGSWLPAQSNLVPNSGFENNTGCPQVISQWFLCNDWTNPNQGTADYFNTCAPSTCWADIPNIWFGPQVPRSDSAYLGVGGFPSGSAEYIQARLTEPLLPGKTYCVEYYVSLVDNTKYASLAPQAYFSDNAITGSSGDPFTFIPHIMDPTVCTDTVSWVRISGDYTARGGEQYITIGYFFENYSDLPLVPNNPTGIDHLYYYIEDVQVFQKATAEAGSMTTTTICINEIIQIGNSPDPGIEYSWYPSNGLSDATISNPLASPDSTTTYILTIADPGSIYHCSSMSDTITIIVDSCIIPPPFSVPSLLFGDEIFRITSLPSGSTITLYDSRGRIVYGDENYQNDFSVVNLENAIYLYEIVLPDQTVKKGKFCVVK